MVWAAEHAISLRDLARLLRERTGLILVLGLGAAALGFGLGTILPRSFQAEGLLVVDPHEINIPDFQTIRSQGTVEPWGARSAARALVSRELVDRVARQLDVGSNPAFNPALRSNLAETLLRATGLSALYRRERLDNAAAWEDLVEAIRRNLTVASEERSYAIGVAFTWRDAIAAADIVNAVMELYVEQELEAKRRAMAEASKQLRRQGEELYADVKATWAQIRQLENSRSMVTTVTGTVISQRLTTLAGEEQNVENESARARADLEQISAAQRSGRANLLNPELVTPRLKVLLEAEASLRGRMAEMTANFGPKHPQMLALQAELDRVVRDIGGEMGAVRSSLLRRLETLEQRKASLKAAADDMGARAASTASGRAQLEQLRAEAQSKNQLYDVYQERYRQTLANLQVIQPDIRIVSHAAPSSRPSSPGPVLLAAIGGLVGIMAGIGGILARRWWLGQVRTPREMSLLSGLPALGAIPKIGGFPRLAGSVQEHVVHSPQSLITETVRGILFRLQSGEEPAPKVIVVTSPLPGEGKTSFTLSLARVAARDGLRSLCVDADFRSPALADRAGVLSSFTIREYIDDAVDFDGAVALDAASGAHLLVGQPAPGDPLHYLEHRRLMKLLSIARSRYDIVIVDTPPVMRVVDPLLMARLADRVVLVVSERGATREVVYETIQRLRWSQTPLAGIVMAQLSGRIPEQYVYSGYASGLSDYPIT
ncbi:MAG: GumC family protein [Hyphomicrobiales bacterium]